MTYEGFIVHSSYQTVKNHTRIFLIGRLRTGETFAIVEERARPAVYVRAGDEEQVRRTVKSAIVESCGYTTIDGETVLRVSWPTNIDQQNGVRDLAFTGVRSYEGDIRFYDQYLIDSQVFGSVSIEGDPVPGRLVNWVFHNPEISASDWIPKLSVLSIDIENNPAEGTILSISMATDTTWREESVQEVIFLGKDLGQPKVQCYENEADLLKEFRDRVVELDPDIITGWNVLEFDFLHIFSRFEVHNIPFVLGRSDQPGNFLPGGRGQSSAVIIPGRQVIDGMRIMRSGPMQFADNRLETVATAVLGTGKVAVTEESNLRGKKKIEALLRSYREDPVTFCEYSLKDSILVIDILDKTGLMDLTIRRAHLTGIGLARAWTSVASFEHLYIASMHKKGLVAPSHGIDAHEMKSAPGGTILPPQPGLHDNVMVFDFKSLYPSIMRTFNVDPVSFVSSHSDLARIDTDTLIQAPNGAYFRRDQAILPEILAGFFERREQAKADGDGIASYVYKIIMNSFYGVLGTSGCRFAASDIAGAITGFAHHLLTWSQKKIEAKGYRVIYGDTDSLFVLPSPAVATDPGSLEKLGAEMADELNQQLKSYVHDAWHVESELELEYECLYLKFFMPPIRSGVAGSHDGNGEPQLRGRAKGYAGLKLETMVDDEPETAFEIKGMEAVRRDWTDAAKKLQVALLTMTFHGQTVEDIRDYIRSFLDNLKSGELDGDLVYRKALRKSVDSYTKTKPPHVKAALLLEEDERRGVIEYVMTVSGPEPVGFVSHPIDYEHYMEKQLKPVTTALSLTLQADLESLFSNDKQSDLF